ncbi:MAG TPA: hypothetical protein VMP67_05630 [Candidatus Limnocylindria bacterium]|nr:hypothetical protein [Candidatus Limnocylindria bacterium]
MATVAEQAQQTAEVKLSSQKDQAASTLHSLAQTIRDGGQRMGDEQPQIASLAEQAATKVDQASSYIREHDLRDFVQEAEGFARREPLIFLGGAFALGFLAARFLKASSPQSSRRSGPQGQRDWSAVGPGRSSTADTFVGGRRTDPVLSGSPSPLGGSEV